MFLVTGVRSNKRNYLAPIKVWRQHIVYTYISLFISTNVPTYTMFGMSLFGFCVFYGSFALVFFFFIFTGMGLFGILFLL